MTEIAAIKTLALYEDRLWKTEQRNQLLHGGTHMAARRSRAANFLLAELPYIIKRVQDLEQQFSGTPQDRATPSDALDQPGRRSAEPASE